MVHALIISRRFYPPWCDGAVAYTRGLVESLLYMKHLGQEVEVTILGSSDDLWFKKWNLTELNELIEMPARVVLFDGIGEDPKKATLKFLSNFKNHIDITHITYSGLDLLSVRIALGLKARNAWILKHQYMTPSYSNLSSVFNMAFNFSGWSYLRSRVVYSSKFLQDKFTKKDQIQQEFESPGFVPPAVNTQRYRRGRLNEKKVVDILASGIGKIRKPSFLSRSDFRILYFGPLINERCRYDLILRSLFRLKKNGLQTASLIMVGRGFEDIRYLTKIREYASRLGLENSIALAAKPLTESEKISLLNYADAIFQPYPTVPKQMLIVDPPITILEAMATEAKAVVSRTESLQNIIRNGLNGFLFQNFDENSIEKTLLEASKADSSVGRNARKTIEDKFSTRAVAQELRLIYKRLCVS
jgi:glycosyltransferase involved in cell wall biosynthesis